jgi:hypothetical protein
VVVVAALLLTSSGVQEAGDFFLRLRLRLVVELLMWQRDDNGSVCVYVYVLVAESRPLLLPPLLPLASAGSGGTVAYVGGSSIAACGMGVSSILIACGNTQCGEVARATRAMTRGRRWGAEDRDKLDNLRGMGVWDLAIFLLSAIAPSRVLHVWPHCSIGSSTSIHPSPVLLRYCVSLPRYHHYHYEYCCRHVVDN